MLQFQANITTVVSVIEPCVEGILDNTSANIDQCRGFECLSQTSSSRDRVVAYIGKLYAFKKVICWKHIRLHLKFYPFLNSSIC